MAKPIRALELHYPMIQILIMFRSRSFCAAPRNHVRGSKTVLDSGLHAVDSGTGFQSLSVGTWIIRIPIVRGIPDFLRDNPDSTSKIFSQSG